MNLCWNDRQKNGYQLSSHLILMMNAGGRCEGRTRDKRIKSPLLYQLS